MLGRTISHYRIVEKLGAGGMGAVYKAIDEQLNRHVAVKVLPSDAQSDEERTRFLQEARAASALDHPNICTIFDAGEFDGQLYIAMACYDGETLRQRIGRGALPVSEAVAIARQVAEGLLRAHEAGVVHRDIKPANIIITSRGVAKILDFGLARISSEPRITRPQTTLGTPAYMSPEQIRGESDLRSDIWSFGVVLYEMLTGQRPFAGETAHSIMFAILHSDPKPVSSIWPTVPRWLDQIVLHMLAKEPRDRYQSFAEVLRDLDAQQSDTQLRSASVPRMRETPSIAVLPFADMSPQRDQEYFCDGIAEELLNALSKLHDLRVASRTSSFQFKGSAADIRAIAEKLNVEHVLEGSVRKAGDKVRVTAQLIGARDGFPLWSDRFDRSLDDIFEIQEEIAQKIVDALRVTLTEREKQAIEKQSTNDIRAYEFYLRGRRFLYQFRRNHFEMARQMFTRAIEIDPQYALGHSGLADCASLLYMFFEATPANLEQAGRASERAIELDPSLAEGYVSRGVAKSLRRDFAGAVTDFETALSLNPRSFEAYYFYARACLVQGQLRKSADLFERASQMRPDDYQSPLLAGPIYIALGEREKGEEVYRRGLAIAEQQLAINPDDARALYLGAAGWIDLDEPQKARDWLARSLAIDPNDPATLFNVACRYARLGERHAALTALEQAIDNGYAYREWIENDPDLESIRNELRYHAVVERVSRAADLAAQPTAKMRVP
jgi:serine/threonine protein kinase/Tfp pilus assembly protein PilF